MSVSGVRVAFHFNAADPVAYTCRLLLKALGKQARLVVCASPEQLAQIDHRLWALGDAIFVPHAAPDAPDHVLQHSPVWLRPQLRGDEPPGVLVNLTQETPAGFERFERLIEVVSPMDHDKAAARQRWRAHTAQGTTPESFDVGNVAA